MNNMCFIAPFLPQIFSFINQQSGFISFEDADLIFVCFHVITKSQMMENKEVYFLLTIVLGRVKILTL
jgi:hypothetical protein